MLSRSSILDIHVKGSRSRSSVLEPSQVFQDLLNELENETAGSKRDAWTPHSSLWGALCAALLELAVAGDAGSPPPHG
ncbi:unnamed protein product [Lota lota]